MSERPPTLPLQPSTTASTSSTSPASSTATGTTGTTHSNSSSSYYSTSATSQSPFTATPTVHSLAPTPAPSRNPSLFPGAENSPAALGLNGSSSSSRGGTAAHLSAAQPGRHFANNADYINALAAAAQASLQSAPSSPGADLPIARSSGKRNSIYGLPGGGGGGGVAAEGGGGGGGGAAQEPALALLPERLSGLQVDEEREAEAEAEEKDGEMDEANGEGGWRNEEAGGPMDLQEQPEEQLLLGDAARGSFLDVDSTPATTPGLSSAAVGDYFHGHESMPGASSLRTEERSDDVTGGPVSSAAVRDVDEMEVEEEGEYEGFTDPFARARAGVSVAKGEGLVVQAGAMMNGQQEQRPPPPQERSMRDRQQSWSEQDLRHEMTARLYKGEAMHGYESTTDRQ